MFFPEALCAGFSLSPAHWSGTPPVLFSINAVCLIDLLYKSIHPERDGCQWRNQQNTGGIAVIFLLYYMMSYDRERIRCCMMSKEAQTPRTGAGFYKTRVYLQGARSPDRAISPYLPFLHKRLTLPYAAPKRPRWSGPACIPRLRWRRRG